MQELKTAIVTGAGSGIGAATAIMLAKTGYRVALVARTRSKLEQVAAKCPGSIVIAGDLSDLETPARVVAEAHEAFGRIDAVVHVAGDAPNLPIQKLTPGIVKQCLDVNLAAAALLAAAAWPIMEKQESGVFVLVSSMASRDPFPGFSIYAAAKIGVNMLVRCIAQEGEAMGIRGVAVAPGAVETPMLRAIFDEGMIPKDKTLAPEAVAQVIAECITGVRTFENGETITVPSP